MYKKYKPSIEAIKYDLLVVAVFLALAWVFLW